MAVLNNLFKFIIQNSHFSNQKSDFLSKLNYFDEILSEFHEHAPNVKNFQFLEKKDPIFRKIRENFGNVPIIQKIIQNYSVVSLTEMQKPYMRSRMRHNSTKPGNLVSKRNKIYIHLHCCKQSWSRKY